MSVTHARTQAAPESTTTPGTERRLLQRQIMPRDRDTDVIRLYIDPDCGLTIQCERCGNCRTVLKDGTYSRSCSCPDGGRPARRPGQ